jgi:hypothetical protein
MEPVNEALTRIAREAYRDFAGLLSTLPFQPPSCLEARFFLDFHLLCRVTVIAKAHPQNQNAFS